MTIDLPHIVGWLVVAWLIYSAVGTNIDRRRLKALTAQGDPSDDPVMARFHDDAGRSQWVAIAIEVIIAAALAWVLTR